MIEKYGTHMDDEEFVDFVKTYDAQVKEANQYLQSRKEFVDANLDSYEKFRNVQHDNEEGNALHNKVMFEDQVDIFWQLQERERLIEFYEMKEVGLEAYRNDANEQQKVRFNEMIEKGQYQIYPGVAVENFKSFISNVAITIIISIMLVISPVFIKDRSRQLLDLQYTMKKGRSLYKTKVAAGLISTFIVMTALLVIYFSFYSLNNTSMFFKVPIHMFIGDFYWYDPTFFQYIVLTIIAIYIIGFVFALLAMSFSSIMPNYISLIGIQIPLVVAMIAFGLPYLMIHIISIWVPKWIVPTTYIVMLLVSVVFIVLLWRREKKRDIIM
jgi:uncharacterized membrane protein YciS (DUF1049 family)